MARNQTLLSGGDPRPQGTSTGPPPPRRQQGGCIGMHHTRPSETRDAATSLSCQLTVLVASRKMDGSFRSFTSTQRKRLPAECQAEHHTCKKSQKLIFQSPGLTPAHTEFIQTEETGHQFPSPGADSLLPPQALGLLKVSAAAPVHEGSQAGKDALMASVLLPTPQTETARRHNPRGNHSQVRCIKGQQTWRDQLPPHSPIPPHDHVQPTTQLPQPSIEGVTSPTLR